MIVQIASHVRRQILAHADAEHPREACGLLLGQAARITEARATRNVAADPETSFEIDPAQLLAAHRGARGAGLRVLGHYHSHPNGHAEPSRRDAARALENGQIWLIAASGGLSAWHAAADGPLHGRFAALTLESC